MTWKLADIRWMKHGQCWTRMKVVHSHSFYSGIQKQVSWGRIVFVFEKTK